jgi:hypothetical protein
MIVLNHFLKLPPVDSGQLASYRIEFHTTSDLPVWSKLYSSDRTTSIKGGCIK